MPALYAGGFVFGEAPWSVEVPLAPRDRNQHGEKGGGHDKVVVVAAAISPVWSPHIDQHPLEVRLRDGARGMSVVHVERQPREVLLSISTVVQQANHEVVQRNLWSRGNPTATMDSKAAVVRRKGKAAHLLRIAWKFWLGHQLAGSIL